MGILRIASGRFRFGVNETGVHCGGDRECGTTGVALGPTMAGWPFSWLRMGHGADLGVSTAQRVQTSSRNCLSIDASPITLLTSVGVQTTTQSRRYPGVGSSSARIFLLPRSKHFLCPCPYPLYDRTTQENCRSIVSALVVVTTLTNARWSVRVHRLELQAR